MAMVNSPKYKFPYSKGNGGLSAHKLLREDKIHLANKVVVDGRDSSKVSWEYCLRPDNLREWVRKLKNGVKLHSNKGRPSALSKEGKEKLVGPIYGVSRYRPLHWWSSVHQEYTT